MIYVCVCVCVCVGLYKQRKYGEKPIALMQYKSGYLVNSNWIFWILFKKFENIKNIKKVKKNWKHFIESHDVKWQQINFELVKQNILNMIKKLFLS